VARRTRRNGPPPTPVLNHGGKKLADILAKNQWVHEDVERLVGAHRGTVSRLIRCERRPGRELALSFEEKLGIDPALWSKPLRERLGAGPGVN
jgi:plasmid maintenance system antidote protein VapI